jgi:hypothetical protein
VDWSGNKGSLGNYGLSLLTKTEIARQQTNFNDANSLIVGSPMSASIKSLQPRRHSRASIGDRRSSIRSIHTDDGGEHEQSEVESIRKRIQRHIMVDRGVTSVNLWKAALTTVITSRKLAYLAPPSSRRREYAGPSLFRSESMNDQIPDGRDQRLNSVANADPTVPTDVKSDTDGTETDPLSTSTITRKAGKSYADTLADPRTTDRASTAITEVTNSPATPKRMFTAHRKGAFSEGSDLQSLSERLSNVQVADHNPERYLEWQRVKQEREGSTYRDTATACQLPLSAFDRILAFTFATPDVAAGWTFGTEGEVVRAQDGAQIDWPGKGLLSLKQQREAFEWGQDSESLVKERKWAKKADSGQQLLLLDAIGCLAYEA